MYTSLNQSAQTAVEPTEAAKEATAAAFGLSAAITVVFNVVLAFIKDAYAPLNSFMVSLTGHHWRTHGFADVVVFLVLGAFFLSRSGCGRHLTGGSAVTLGTAVVLASAALGLWFVLF